MPDQKISDLSASTGVTGNEKIPTTMNGVNEYITPTQIKTFVDVPDLSNVVNSLQLLDSNKDTDGTLAANSDTKIPSQKAVKTYADTKIAKTANITALNENGIADDELCIFSLTNKDIRTSNITSASIVTAASTTTFTNKTIDANGTGNSISNLETADFAANVVDTAADLSSNSDTRLSSQKAIKSYVDGVYINAVANDQKRYCGILVRPGITIVDGDHFTVDAPASWNYNDSGTIKSASWNDLGENLYDTLTWYLVANGGVLALLDSTATIDYKTVIPIYTIVDGVITKTWDTLVENIRPEIAHQDIVTMKTALQEPTGFDRPENVIVTYDVAEKKVTLTGTWNVYCNGILNTTIVTGYISAAHGSTLEKTYWLYADCGGVYWSDSFPGFNKLLIAGVIYRTNDKFALRECHGLMQWQAHESEHYTIGCFKKSGGTASGVTLLSTTTAERRPDISECVIQDEDLPTTNAALTSKAYALRYLSATDTIEYDIDASDILRLNGAVPYYNPWNGSAFVQTAMPANSLMTIWLYEVPVSADTDSQKYRHVFVQGQTITQAASASAGALTTAYNTELAKSTLDLNLGTSSLIAAEYVAIGKFIIQYTSNDWTIRNISTISGTKASQVGSPTGSFLNSVSTDTTMTGSGVVADPLTVVQNYILKTTDVTAINEAGIADDEIVVFNKTNKDLRTSNVLSANIVTPSSTSTLTNKTIDANGTGNAISNLETADFAANVIDTDATLAANSDTRVATQKATKAYADGRIAKTTNITALNETGIADDEICVFNLTNKDIRSSNITSASVSTASSTTTFTNKTIDANGTGNSISNLETADFAANVIDTDHAMAADSDTRIPSQNAVKAYIDGKGIIALSGKSETTYGTIAIGLSAGTDLAAGSTSNVLIGTDAGRAVTTGDDNVLLGNFAGGILTTGINNVCIGKYAGARATGSSKFYVSGGQAGAATEADGIAASLLYGTFSDTTASQTLRINATPSIMGAYTLPITDGTADYVLKTNGSGVASWAANNATIGDASVTLAKMANLDNLRVIGRTTASAGVPESLTMAQLSNMINKDVIIQCVGGTTDLTVVDGIAYFVVPASLNGMNLSAVAARVITAGTTNSTVIDIYNVTDSHDMLSTGMNIETTETSTTTSQTPGTIDTSYDDVATSDLIRVDITSISTTAPKGLIVNLTFSKPVA